MSEVQKFCAWVEDQVTNHGLLQISCVRFDRGQTAMDVLVSKQKEAVIYGVLGMHDETEAPTLEEIAKGFNQTNAAIASGEYKEYKEIDFEDSTHPKPNGEPSELTKQILWDVSNKEI